MIYILLGLALWVSAHMFKRVLPDMRESLGNKGRPIVAIAIALGVALMIYGYRGSEDDYLYDLPEWGWIANNILMFFALVLMDIGRAKGVVRTWIRHPMLTGVLLWGIAHLLVNSDTASVLLFGGLASWAVLQMLAINMREGAWQRPEKGSVAADIKFVAIASALYAAIVAAHFWFDKVPVLWW